MRLHRRVNGVLAANCDITATAQYVKGDNCTASARVEIARDLNVAGGNRSRSLNIVDRNCDKLTPESIHYMVSGNLIAPMYCVTVALPFMRAQKDGVLIHTASMAGRFIGGVSGPIYVSAKHGIVAMSHGLNMQECVNGIRSTVFLPGEVATPILDQRPNPVGPEVRARMVQPADCGDLIRYIACLPPHVTMNEVHLAPTWNRGYVANLERKL